MKRIASLLIILAVIIPLISQIAAPQQVMGLSINVQKSGLLVKVYPDGSVKLIYSLKAYISLPPGALSNSRIDLSTSYESKYEEHYASSSLELSGTIESPNMSTSKGLISIELETSATQTGHNINAELKGSIILRNETENIQLKITDASIKATNSSKALFHIEIEAKGIKPEEGHTGKAPSISEVNEKLRRSGIDFIEVNSLGAIVEQDNKTKLIVSGVIDIDRMLQDAIASGMSSADAAKLKKLLETSLDIDTKAKISINIDTSNPHRALLKVKYSSETRGDIEKAEKVYKEATPLVNELATALLRRIAQATGNEKLMQILLVSSMTATRPSQLPVVAVPPTSAKAEVHVYNEGDKIVIEASYEGPKERITPSSGNPSTDAQKMLTLLSAQLVQAKSQLARLGLVVQGIDKVIPNTVTIQPAANVVVSKTKAQISELPSIRVEVTGVAGTATKTQPKTTTSTSTATKTTGTATSTPQPQPGATGTTTTSTPSSTHSAAQSTSKTTTRAGKGLGTPVLAGIAIAVIAIVVAILLARRGG